MLVYAVVTADEIVAEAFRHYDRSFYYLEYIEKRYFLRVTREGVAAVCTFFRYDESACDELTEDL